MTTTDLAPVSGEIEQSAPLLPMMSAAHARGAMSAYQELCAAVLEPADWIGRPGEPDSFVRRSGWSKLQTFYGASTELIGDTRLERDDDGKLIRASARARAIARDGRYAEGGGACARSEKRFQSSSGRQKIEHDLPASAETRATNRAIANLIGFGAVSAEEVDAGAASDAPALPDWATDIPDDALNRLEGNLVAILTAVGVPEGDVPAATLTVGNTITTYCDGTFPAACARLVHLLAQSIPTTAPADAAEPEPVPYGQAPDTPAEPDTPEDPA